VVIRRGEIWWADLAEPRGSEPGFRRPVLIVQSDDFNRSALRTVLAAVITSNQLLAEAPGNVLLSRRDSGLPRTSVVNVSQLITVDKQFLESRIKRLSDQKFAEVESGLRLILELQ
jgi:mRNA interferase MazF